MTSVPEQSLITDEHRAAIGVKSPPSQVTVKAADAARIRQVLGDTDPRYADGSELAPPYIIAMLGQGQSGAPQVKILPSMLLTQQEWKFSRPFKIGETLTAVSQIFDIRDRLGGRYGYSVLVTNGTDYYDADGNHVGAVMTTITQFDPNTEGKGKE